MHGNKEIRSFETILKAYICHHNIGLSSLILYLTNKFDCCMDGLYNSLLDCQVIGCTYSTLLWIYAKFYDLLINWERCGPINSNGWPCGLDIN